MKTVRCWKPAFQHLPSLPGMQELGNSLFQTSLKPSCCRNCIWGAAVTDSLKKLSSPLQMLTLKKKILLLHPNSNYLPIKQIRLQNETSESWKSLNECCLCSFVFLVHTVYDTWLNCTTTCHTSTLLVVVTEYSLLSSYSMSFLVTPHLNSLNA